MSSNGRPERDVLLCRDCCCGTARKHPRTDHAAQRDAIEACGSTPGVRVRVVDCLDECERSNVVLVRDFTAMRAGRARRPVDVWLGGVLDEHATAEVVAWVEQGGELPSALERYRFKGRRQ